jgi:hypothetical protein
VSVTDAKTGVTLTTPTLMTPANNQEIRNVDQPVTLTIKNAVTTGTTALTYTFEVATDAGFGSKVYTKTNVAQGASGQTALTVDRLTPDRTYFWRAFASSGDLAGPTPGARGFVVGPEVILQTPLLGDPQPNASVSDEPVINVNTVRRTGPAGQIFYRFEIAESAAFNPLVYTATVPERTDLPYTPHLVARKLDEKTYFWRALATDPSNGVTSPYSAVSQFKVSKGVDLRKANIVIGPANIGEWEETAVITDAYWTGANGGLLCINHTRLGIWPPTLFASDGTTIEGNQWVFAFLNGEWWCGAADWYRPGQACKGIDAFSIGRDAFYLKPATPIYSWVPQSGETFAVMSTTPARAWPVFRTYDERTNVALIKWP